MIFHGIIYKITNLINNKIYVGQTTQSMEYRLIQHSKTASYNKSMPICNSIKKYGIVNFKIETLDWATNQTELNYKEWLWISTLDTLNKEIGYNIRTGGNRKEMNESYRENISKGQRKGTIKPFKVFKINDNKLILVGTYTNKTACAEELNLNKFGVYRALSPNNKLTTYGGYKFIDATQEIQGRLISNQKPFDVFKADTKEYVGSWANASACAIDLKIKDNSGICKCLTGKLVTSSGYLFCYKTDNMKKLLNKLDTLQKFKEIHV